MANSLGKTCILLMAAFLVLSTGACAAAPIATIASGNTVFLGEEGLDITAALNGDTRVGWWASAASISTTSPSYTISVSDPAAFFINPTEFMGKLGVWYHLNPDGRANGTAFLVADPNLDLRVEDATLDYDATNGWIPTGDEIQFRITTNLVQMTERAGVSSVPIKLVVESPDGARFTALTNRAGVATSLSDIPVSTSPYSTGPIWDTSRRDTNPFGTYKIWAECNVNSMKDNYGAEGKTYTRNAGVLSQDDNPLISLNTRTTVMTTVTTAPTTKATPITTAATPITTPPATVPATTTVPATVTTAPPATVATTLPAKTPGFGTVLAGTALLIALVLSARKE